MPPTRLLPVLFLVWSLTASAQPPVEPDPATLRARLDAAVAGGVILVGLLVHAWSARGSRRGGTHGSVQ